VAAAPAPAPRQLPARRLAAGVWRRRRLTAAACGCEPPAALPVLVPRQAEAAAAAGAGAAAAAASSWLPAAQFPWSAALRLPAALHPLPAQPRLAGHDRHAGGAIARMLPPPLPPSAPLPAAAAVPANPPVMPPALGGGRQAGGRQLPHNQLPPPVRAGKQSREPAGSVSAASPAPIQGLVPSLRTLPRHQHLGVKPSANTLQLAKPAYTGQAAARTQNMKKLLYLHLRWRQGAAGAGASGRRRSRTTGAAPLRLCAACGRCRPALPRIQGPVARISPAARRPAAAPAAPAMLLPALPLAPATPLQQLRAGAGQAAVSQEVVEVARQLRCRFEMLIGPAYFAVALRSAGRVVARPGSAPVWQGTEPTRWMSMSMEISVKVFNEQTQGQTLLLCVGLQLVVTASLLLASNSGGYQVVNRNDNVSF